MVRRKKASQEVLPETSSSTDTVGSNEEQRELMRILGIPSMPNHQIVPFHVDKLIIPGATLPNVVRDARERAESIRLVGVLQPPLVVLASGTSAEDPEATGLVIAGRRRSLGARIAKDEYGCSPYVECSLYDASCTPARLRALFSAIEDFQRRNEWRKQVQNLAELTEEGIGLKEEDLLHMGFPAYALRERLKMAQLPPPLRLLIVDGTMNQSIARCLIRLDHGQQQMFAEMAEVGETLTAEVVRQVLRDEIASQQQALFTEETLASDLQQTVKPIPVDELPSLLQMLLRFEQGFPSERTSGDLLLLSRTLRQRMEVLLRTQETVTV